jgi:uncharacterized protein (TIGR02145 family)
MRSLIKAIAIPFLAGPRSLVPFLRIASVTYQWNDELETDATITVVSTGGVGIREYRIDGGAWQVQNTFVVAEEKEYLVEVRDQIGQQRNRGITIERTFVPPVPVTGIIYGYLYNWWVTQNEISSHEDWNVPTDADISSFVNGLMFVYGLVNNLDDPNAVGNHLKSIRVHPVDHPRWDHNATHIPLDTFGFNALPAGQRLHDGGFSTIGSICHIWSTDTFEDIAWRMSLNVNNGYWYRTAVNKKGGHSIRLMRAATGAEIANLSDGDAAANYIGNDDKVYRTVYINQKVWLAENLAETRYRNGSRINKVTPDVTWAGLSTAAYCAYQNNEDYAYVGEVILQTNIVYGYLYNWYALTGGVNEGDVISNKDIDDGEWTMPSVNDTNILRNYINATYNITPNNFGAGNHLKSCRQINSPLGGSCNTVVHPRWDEDVINYGRNSVNLNILPGGGRWHDIDEPEITVFMNMGSFAPLWLRNEFRAMFMVHNGNDLYLNHPTLQPIPSIYGYASRLVRPATVAEQTLPDGLLINKIYRGNDNKVYRVTKIGTQVWMAENLAEIKYYSGADIPNVTAQAEWGTLTTGARCAYDNNEDYAYIGEVIPQTNIVYGYLYNWWATQEEISSYAAWDVPTSAQIITFRDYLMQTYSIANNNTADGLGNHLKGIRVSPATDPKWNSHATHIPLDTFGFNAYPGGERSLNGTFELLGWLFVMWSRSVSVSNPALGTIVELFSSAGDFTPAGAEQQGDKPAGRSIRLVRTATVEEENLADGTNVANYIGNDGRVYRTVKIGTQVWLAENLAETKFRDGSYIQKVFSASTWLALTTPAYCAMNNTDSLAVKDALNTTLIPYVPQTVVSDIDPGIVLHYNNNFHVPLDISEFSFTDNDFVFIYILIGNEWILISTSIIPYHEITAVANIYPPDVTYSNSEFAVPQGINEFSFTDDGRIWVFKYENEAWNLYEYVEHYSDTGPVLLFSTQLNFDTQLKL